MRTDLLWPCLTPVEPHEFVSWVFGGLRIFIIVLKLRNLELPFNQPCGGASLVAQLVKNPPAMRETWVRSLGWEDPLEQGKTTHSSILV